LLFLFVLLSAGFQLFAIDKQGGFVNPGLTMFKFWRFVKRVLWSAG